MNDLAIPALTLEQRVELLEIGFGRATLRATLHATNVALAAVGASHVAPGAINSQPAPVPSIQRSGIEGTAQTPEDLAALPDAATAPYVRRVVCAANRNTNRGLIFIGPRHFDEPMKNQMISCVSANEIMTEELPRCQQGFIDQHGVFMTREEAWQVAAAAGQIRYRCGGDGEKLFSENLY